MHDVRVYSNIKPFPYRPLEVVVFKWMEEKLQSDDDRETSGKHGLDHERMHKTFSQLGGDSLSATHLSSLLREHLSLDLPVDILLKTPLVEIMSNVSSKNRPSATSTDWGKEASIVSLGLDRTQGEWPPLSGVAEVSSSVLLTGCTGFLGRFILWELLQNSQVTRVFCLAKMKDGT